MSTQAQRVITLYATRGGKKKITSNVSSWKELYPLIKREGYDIDKLHATDGNTKVDLVHEDAVLPVGEFIVFMRPKATKSGVKAKRADGLGKKELTLLVKGDIAEFDNGKEFYTGYSSLGVPALANLVNTFKGKVAKAKAPAKTAKAPAKTTTATKKPAVKASPVKKTASPKKEVATSKKVTAKTKEKPTPKKVDNDADEDAELARELADIERKTKK